MTTKLNFNFGKKPEPLVLENKPAPAPEPAKRGVLFGTGITKKVAEKEQGNKTFFEIASAKEKKKLDFMAKVKSVELPTEVREVFKLPVAETIPIVDLEVEPHSDITLDEYQTAALAGLRNQKYGVLIGAAGTGKTTVLKKLVEQLEKTVPIIDINSARSRQEDNQEENYNVAIAFCSFTGRAVQQMKKALPENYHPMCSTIHSLLGYAPVFEDRIDEETGAIRQVKIFRPSFTAANKLPYKIVIVDEAGMLAGPLSNELFDALLPDCRVFMVGDINQLPPVMGKSVLGFGMINWPTFTLEKIHRQAAGNPIIANAHNVLQGLFPLPDEQHFPIVTDNGGSLDIFNTLTATVKHLHQHGLFDPFRDAVIVPQNKGTLGQVHINENLVKYFNPPQKIEGVTLNPREMIKAGGFYVTFAIGDKVMLLQNDRERGLTNGMIGKVTDIKLNGLFNESRAPGMSYETDNNIYDLTGIGKLDLQGGSYGDQPKTKEETDKENDELQRQASHSMTVEFYIQTPDGNVEESEVVFSTAGQFRKITHSYAFTCHKAQGAEYPTVVICIHSANAKMLNREWFYTALTRAQERVILVCNNRGMSIALRNQRITGKTVMEKAEQFLAMSESLPDEQLPYLPAAETIEIEELNNV